MSDPDFHERAPMPEKPRPGGRHRAAPDTTLQPWRDGLSQSFTRLHDAATSESTQAAIESVRSGAVVAGRAAWDGLSTGAVVARRVTRESLKPLEEPALSVVRRLGISVRAAGVWAAGVINGGSGARRVGVGTFVPGAAFLAWGYLEKSVPWIAAGTLIAGPSVAVVSWMLGRSVVRPVVRAFQRPEYVPAIGPDDEPVAITEIRTADGRVVYAQPAEPPARPAGEPEAADRLPDVWRRPSRWGGASEAGPGRRPDAAGRPGPPTVGG